MQPVWVLSVDLQTKTATFQSGLSDAAKSARGAFNDIKGGAGDMGRATSGNMMEARHSVMMLGEEFGVHLPRALTSFIASIGPIGAAMEAAFPFLAIAVGATLLIEHLVKMREEGEKLTEDQVKFGTAVENAFNMLDNKLIQAQIKADELRHDHLGALKGQLELIDHQSMEELVQAFEKVEKAADIVFKGLKTSWYQFGAGSDGAKHALETFQTQYDSLLAQGKTDQASGLLGGTLKQAEQILAFQKQYVASQSKDGSGGDYNKFEEASNGLKKMNVSIASTTIGIQKETEAQQTLVDALRAQVEIESRVAQIKTLEKSNATTSANQKVGKDNDAEAEAAMEARREAADAEIKLLREAGEKTVQQLNQTEREKIDATRAGTAARLQAIVSAIQNEESWGLKDSAFYRQLLMERVNTERVISEEEAKLKEEAGKEDAENTQKLGELGLAALRQSFLLQDSARRVNAAQIATEETTLANAEFNLKMQAFARELSALDKSGKDYANKLKAIQDKEKQLTQQHENELTAIKEKAEIASNQRILAGWQQFSSQMASGLSQSIMGHQTWARMLSSIGDQVVSGMIQNAIKSMLVADMDKEKQAAKAARAAFNIGMSIGGPAGIVLGPVFGAAAFAAEMAFQGGGVVPGVGRGDIVPAMLEPGEGVVPKGVMAGLSDLAKSGSMGSGGDHYTVHVRPTYHVQTIDGNGMQAALEKHTDVLQRHFESAVRKMNR